MYEAEAKMVNKPVEESSFISVHPGNGASVCYQRWCNSVDTSLSLHRFLAL
ncbi:hypothetical protein O9993_00485 [Vibrio lentus]|nr:hypothetical protein [Vibrio lentus]